jgi:hypothetical protein
MRWNGWLLPAEKLQVFGFSKHSPLSFHYIHTYIHTYIHMLNTALSPYFTIKINRIIKNCIVVLCSSDGALTAVLSLLYTLRIWNYPGQLLCCLGLITSNFHRWRSGAKRRQHFPRVNDTWRIMFDPLEIIPCCLYYRGWFMTCEHYCITCLCDQKSSYKHVLILDGYGVKTAWNLE